MGESAHHIRLEANDLRHADKDASIPTAEQAEQSIEFTEALGDILFVLPSSVIEPALQVTVAANDGLSATATRRFPPSDPPV
jgi:hypothetical protein